MKKLRIKVSLALILVAIIGVASVPLLSSPVFAHRSGCHRWHSCPSDSGSYACGDTGYSNYCSSSTYNAYTPAITTKDEVVDESIPAGLTDKDNSNEYVGYKKLITEGNAGKQTLTTSITYTDGVESSRGNSMKSTILSPVSAVYEVGTRVKPTTYIDYIWKSDNQSFWSFLLAEYDIAASASPNSDYALIKNDQVIRLGKSGKTGMLNFDGVGVRTGDKLAIGTYTGGQFLWFMPSASKVSELSTVDTEKFTVISEYDAFHNKISDRTNKKTVILQCTEAIKNEYMKSMDEIDKMYFDSQESERIYYTEIPCDIQNLNYKK